MELIKDDYKVMLEVFEGPLDLLLYLIKKDEVAVLKQEAVGMYEVAVLAAGSADSLNKWMTDNGYRYPVIPYRLREDVIAEHTLVGPDRLRILRDWTHLDTSTGRYDPHTGHSELYSMVAADFVSVLP